MTHLSDYSYLDRLVSNLIFFPLLLWFCFVDKQAHKDLLSPKKDVRRRFLILTFYILSYIMGISYDAITTKMKYSEGFVDTCLVQTDGETNKTFVFRHPKEAFEKIRLDPGTPFMYNGPLHINASYTNAGGCGIKQTPTSMYTEHNFARLEVIDTLWNLQCTLRNSALFLLLGFFNYTMKQYFRSPCLTRWEVRFFTFYSFFSLGSYFVLPQIVMSTLLSTVSSQLLWSVELYIASAFLLNANHRIDKLLKEKVQAMSTNGQNKLLESIYYVKVMNNFLALVTIGEGTGLFIINMDIVMVEWQVILASKLLTDIFTRVFNFFFVIEPIVAIFILYKPGFLHTRDVRRLSTRVTPSDAPSSRFQTEAISKGGNAELLDTPSNADPVLQLSSKSKQQPERLFHKV